MITYILLAGAALLGTAYYLKPSGKDSYQDITVDELDQLLKNKNTVLIDVRTKKEIKAGVIGKPLLIELGSNMIQDFKPLDREKKYILYCRSGRRSVLASKMMLNLGFKDVNNLLGGYNAWIANK